jgi:uncharacterized protein
VILCDTGPLLCLVDKKQPQHQACRKAFRELRKPFTTTWACFTEAMYLAGRQGKWAMQKELSDLLLLKDVLNIHEIRQDDCPRLFQLMEKYKDTPMDLADATLTVASERLGVNQILTLDSDFYIYLINDSTRFDILYNLPPVRKVKRKKA